MLLADLAIEAETDDTLQIFVANEANTDVFFDNISITHEQHLIVQENHYYPFGMNLVGIEKEGMPEDRFQYNGKEKQVEFGLNWADYGARFYDATLGRFFTQDRFAEKYYDFTPYQYGANNPIKFIDVNGDSIYVVNNGKLELINNSNGSKYGYDILMQTKAGKALLKKYQNSSKHDIYLSSQNYSTDKEDTYIGAITSKGDKYIKNGVIDTGNESVFNGLKVKNKSAILSLISFSNEYLNGKGKNFENEGYNQYSFAESLYHEIYAHIENDLGDGSKFAHLEHLNYGSHHIGILQRLTSYTDASKKANKQEKFNGVVENSPAHQIREQIARVYMNNLGTNVLNFIHNLIQKK